MGVTSQNIYTIMESIIKKAGYKHMKFDFHND